MNNMKFVYITLAVLLCIVAVTIYFNKPDTETIYVKGKDSVVVKTEIDTVYIPKYFIAEKTIVDTVHITHFNMDSSIVRDTVINNMDTVIATITTYPVIDSLKLNLDLRLKEKVITISDSIWITRVDTLKTTTFESAPWYDNFIFGALSTAIVTILVIFGLQ